MKPEARTNALPFLFSDIGGSTRRWEVHREAMEEALLHHVQLQCMRSPSCPMDSHYLCIHGTIMRFGTLVQSVR